MEARLIDVNDYIRTGEGANGASYNHKSDPKYMLKLNREDLPRSIAENELIQAQKVYDLGIPSTKPGELVTDGKRFGILFERILNKVSFSRAVGDNPSLAEFYARRFAHMCLQLHSVHIPKGLFPSQKEIYYRFLEENKSFDLQQKAKIKAFIENVPDSDVACHGDLQFSNVITDGEKDYFIDLGEFCYGHPYFDLGQVYLCCVADSPEFIRETFHMEPETALVFWNFFVDEYFGHGADIDKINEMIIPFAGLKTLLIEHYTGCSMPQFHHLLDSILK